MTNLSTLWSHGDSTVLPRTMRFSRDQWRRTHQSLTLPTSHNFVIDEPSNYRGRPTSDCFKTGFVECLPATDASYTIAARHFGHRAITSAAPGTEPSAEPFDEPVG
jgi:hypothetical protein